MVMGLDLGSQEVGLAVVEALEGRFVLRVCLGYRLGRASLPERLAKLHHWLSAQLHAWPAALVAIEDPFVGKNARSALALGTVKGLVWGMLLGLGRPAPLLLAPSQVKKAITGQAHAPKEQVAAMLVHYLGEAPPLPDNTHATDAVAIALAAAFLQNSPIKRTFTNRAER
ncbi:MAG: crossover junction endodeoxyribonuclease RuvC [Bacteroidetes bacterium]|nr:MAG: crossover junction endodeoxyribonuclease RuvC [Bacteroidota bacterium]